MSGRIRLATEADGASIAAVYRPYVEDSCISFEEAAPSGDEIARRIGNGHYPWLVIEDEGLLGFASTSAMRPRPAYRWSVESGIYLVPEAQGRGLGRKLLAAHLDMLERQGFVTVLANIALPNDASVALHEKLGFTLSGVERGVGFKLGRWVDVGRWQRDLAPRSAAPAEPRPPA